MRAYDRNLRKEDARLGEDTTNETGHYDIHYTIDNLGRPEKLFADLVIVLIDPNTDKPVFTSPTQFNAGFFETLNATYGTALPQPSEYERLMSQIQPHLNGEPLNQLAEKDIEYLAGASTLPQAQVQRLVQSAQQANENGLPDELFYALSPSGDQDALTSLLGQGREALRRAVLQAIEENLVPASLKPRLDELIDQRLPEVQARRLLRKPADGQPPNLGALLGILPKPLSNQKQLSLAQYLTKSKALDSSLQDALKKMDFTTAEAAAVDAASQLMAITANHLPLVKDLLERRPDGSISLRFLAALTPDDWSSLVKKHEVPPGIEGKGPVERERNYLNRLESFVETLYPTAVIASRVEQNRLPVSERIRPALAQFFQQNPDFEFSKNHPDAYLEKGGGARLAGIDPNLLPGLKEELLTIDRMLKVAERPSQAAVLMEKGLGSAYQIVNMGKQGFYKAVGNALKDEVLDAIFRQAQENSAMSSALLIRYGQEYNSTDIAVLPPHASYPIGQSDPASGLPDLRSLFGGLEGCNCAECDSAYSPAAYLVDLLQFLANCKLTDKKTLKDVLLDPKRRPDLGEIELTCANTDTSVPYIDLVNEVLENAVTPRPAKTFPQTTWTEEELAVAPQWLNQPAYDKLKGGKYPWTLPFNLWLEIARRYLIGLKVSRQKLMETTNPDGRLSDSTIGWEVLGTSKEESDILTDTNPNHPWEFWGLPDQQVTKVYDALAGSDRSGTWNDLLSYASMMMQQAKISYADLVNLVNTRFIQNTPGGSPLDWKGDECDPANRTLVNLDSAKLVRMNRFLRLWKRLGWSMYTLDRAIAAFNPPEINTEFLLWLSHIRRLQDQFSLPVETLLSWWAPIDTYSYEITTDDRVQIIPSLYEQVFYKKPLDPSMAINAAGTELAAPYDPADPVSDQATITKHRPAVTAGLRISAADLNLLVGSEVPDELNMANLSQLYRIATLARAQKLSISEWKIMKALTGIDPFPNTLQKKQASQATWAFIEEVQWIHASVFSPAELDALLREQFQPVTGLAAAQEQAAQALDALRKGLQRIQADNSLGTEPPDELTRRKLSELGWDTELIETALSSAFLNSDPRFAVPLDSLPNGISFPADLQKSLKDKIQFDPINGILVAFGMLRKNERDDLIALNSSSATAYRKAVQDLYKLSNKDGAARIDFVKDRMQSFQLPTHQVTLEFTAPLASLPSGVVFPDKLPEGLRGQVTYDDKKKLLRCKGLLSTIEKASLVALAPKDTNYTQAVEAAAVWIDLPNKQGSRTIYDPASGELRFSGWMSEAEKNQLMALSDQALSGKVQYQQAIDQLFQDSQTYREKQPTNQFLTEDNAKVIFYDKRTTRDRFELVLKKLLPYLQRSENELFTSQQLSQAGGLTPEVASDLLRTQLNHPTQPAQKLIEAFLDPSFATSSAQVKITPAVFPEQFAAYHLFSKAALLITRYQLMPTQTGWLFLSVLGWLNINNLPIQPIQNATEYGGWRKLDQLMRLRDDLPGQDTSLQAIVDEANGATGTVSLLSLLNQLFGWDSADLAFAAGQNQFDLTTPDDFRDPQKLSRLKALFDLLSQLGATASQSWDWSKASPGQPEADAIQKAVQGRKNPDAWQVWAREARDGLRRAQRQALVDYLVAAEPALRDAAGLYDRYLIDPKMEPCMETTRVRQATNTVQLFVQRCLVNQEYQENNVSPSIIDQDRWEYIKNYRVWEANHKVFLYTENYLEPELRGGKSQFFTELESELAQNNLTDEKAETALRNYLTKLDQVARMQILGMVEDEDENGERLHVFGRTLSTPPAFYYRRRENGVTWTPWEKVELDIEGDHLVPMVWRGRLFLFWPIFSEKSDEPKEVPTTAELPKKYWSIQMAFSEYKEGRWQPKKISPAAIHHPYDAVQGTNWDSFDKNNYAFRGLAGDDVITIWMYGPNYKLPGDPSTQTNTLRAKREDSAKDMDDGYGGAGSPLPKGLIYGYVTDLNKKGIQNIQLILEYPKRSNTPPSAPPHTTFTFAKQEGYYVFHDLPEGTYSICVPDQKGFTFDKSSVCVKISRDEPCQIDFMAQQAQPAQGLPAPELNFVPFEQIDIGFLFDGRQVALVDRDRNVPPEKLITPPQMERVGMLLFEHPNQNIPNDPLSGDLGYPIDVLDITPGIFNLLYPHTDPTFTLLRPFFYQDNQRGYCVSPYQCFELQAYLTALFNALKSEPIPQVDPQDFVRQALLFQTSFHPLVTIFLDTLQGQGLDGFFSRAIQRGDIAPHFEDRYKPNEALVLPGTLPEEDVDFHEGSAYSLYNWEMFFHAPLLIATQLSKNQRFAEAQKWFHYIFDPTDSSTEPAPARYWRTLPFFNAGKTPPIQELLDLLNDNTVGSEVKAELAKSVRAWCKNPFKSHAIARWRISAYQKSVVMKYIDNLLDWGDQLFRRDTIESINLAAQLYQLAEQILGPQPEVLPPKGQAKPQTYNGLEPLLDGLSNALVQAENLIRPGCLPIPGKNHPPDCLPPLPFYFCIPRNEQLLEYWNKVEDRMKKIHNCMNIEGVVRPLSLYDTEINPLKIIQAVAGGQTVDSILNDINAPLPHYRFSYLVQKASELTGEVKALGNSLLSAMEKEDAEALARLRARHEQALLETTTLVKKAQVDEARASLEALQKSQDMAKTRLEYYINLLTSKITVDLPALNQDSSADIILNTLEGFMDQVYDVRTSLDSTDLYKSLKPVVQAAQALIFTQLRSSLSLTGETGSPNMPDSTGLPISAFEKRQLDELKLAHDSQQLAMGYETLAQVLALIPEFSSGVQGTASTPVAMFTIGGQALSGSARLQSELGNFVASEHSYRANLHSILGSYERRAMEWSLQCGLAYKEWDQINAQIEAATSRLTAAAQELRVHARQMEQSQEISDFLSNQKFTNQELYHWMVGQLSKLYFQVFQLAYDLSRKAENALRWELGLQDSSFIRFGYWDDLYKGLMAGEQLALDLKRMENAYLDQNRREFEITKNISLLSLDPGSLLQLRQTGSCEVSLPEVLFDLDYPNHYLRRIKTVSLSIPCVTGPYRGVYCTLILLKSSIRYQNTLYQGEYERSQQDDARFVDYYAAIQSIATSSGQMDNGMFELNLRDERYLPFEGSGAISQWRLELPSDFRQFDYETIADVILHIRYTAREGGSQLSRASTSSIKTGIENLIRSQDQKGLAQAFSLRSDFSNEWYRLKNIADANGDHIQTISLSKDRFPFLFDHKEIHITGLDLYAVPKNGGKATVEPVITLPDGITEVKLDVGTPIGRLVHWTVNSSNTLNVKVETDSAQAKWEIKVVKNNMQKVLDPLEDIQIVCTYKVM